MSKKFKPSLLQAAFFTWIETGSGSCILEAVAGSGKTTTLIEALSLMSGSIFFGAYNKKIAEEISARAPKRSNLFISTMHAAGFGIWRKFASKVRVDNNKCRDIFRAASSRNPQYEPYEGVVLALVSYAKQAAVGVSGYPSPSDINTWRDLIDHFGVDTLENDSLVIALAKKLLEKSIESDHIVIDFDDMIYAPIVHAVRVFKHDWVLVDEAQDTNAARRALALLLLKPNGRLVAVGDRFQAIYGFTGADADALDKIGNAVGAITLPLNVSYRCSKSIVTYAQKYVNHIEALETAPEGIVRPLAAHEQLINTVKPGDAILCRFNAPLIRAAYAFIAAGVPAKVEGREIGTGLKVLARRWKLKTFSALLTKLEDYLEKETAKFLLKEQENRAGALNDKVECLKVLIARVMSIDPNPSNIIDRLCLEIDNIFGDNVGVDCVLLSSIHKSKGREWTKVFWLQTGPSKWATQDWELDQENNLCYVAITRAISELVLCQLETKKE